MAKLCNDESLKAIKASFAKGLNPCNGTGKDILNRITQFLTRDTSATYDREGQDLFANAETLQAAIKKCDAAAHDKPWIRDQAQSVNMTSEDNKGELLRTVTNSASSANMHIFFPYFKVLFKLCQLGMMLKSKESLVRKQEAAAKEMKSLEVQIETQKTLIENLSFHERIAAEVEREKQGEIFAVMHKDQEL